MQKAFFVDDKGPLLVSGRPSRHEHEGIVLGRLDKELKWLHGGLVEVVGSYTPESALTIRAASAWQQQHSYNH